MSGDYNRCPPDLVPMLSENEKFSYFFYKTKQRYVVCWYVEFSMWCQIVTYLYFYLLYMQQLVKLEHGNFGVEIIPKKIFKSDIQENILNIFVFLNLKQIIELMEKLMGRKLGIIERLTVSRILYDLFTFQI